MTAATINVPSVDISRLADAIAPKRSRSDFFGLVPGYRAYLIYTHLEAKSDPELARLGLNRRDLPRIALEAAFDLKDA